MLSKSDISFIRSLSNKRNRDDSGLFVVDGYKLVEEALRSGFSIDRVFVSSEDDLGVSPVAELVSRKDIERMSSLKTPQGVLAVVEKPEYLLSECFGKELSLALDCIQDPGNLGTVIRVADWFGINDIVCSPDTVDCFNPKVIQSTMGAIFRVRISYKDLSDVFQDSLGNGVPVYGTYLEGENIYTSDLGDVSSGIIVMGNEGNGISPGLSGFISRKLFIPSYPSGDNSCESLNVGTAASIVVSEFRRRL